MNVRAAFAFVAASAACAACTDAASHVYEGRFYVEARGCLGTTSSVDVVEGPSPGACNTVCLVSKARADASRSVFVATMCGPYPIGFDVSGTDPVCTGALDAFERNDTCLSDGGSTAPFDAGDASDQ